MSEDLARHRKHLEILVEERTAEVRESREQLRDLASHLQSVRETERTEIAREIHDELGQSLTALKMDVHWLGQKIPSPQKPVAGKLAAMSRLIDQTVQSVRRISSELRPKLLDDLGLSAALEWQANEFRGHSGVRCKFRSEPEDIILDQARSTAFFRIFQETLTNIARHARATRVEVILRKNSDSVELTVHDNGQGVSAEQLRDSRSLGIIGMRERAHSLGGEMQIVSVLGQGTTVKVNLPLAAESGDDQDSHS
jgi:signal transduction histidine kinase